MQKDKDIPLSGKLKTSEPDVKIKELENELYKRAIKEDKLYFYVSFVRKDEKEENLFHYKIMQVEIETKEQWQELFNRLKSIGVGDDIMSFAKKKSASFSPSSGISFPPKK